MESRESASPTITRAVAAGLNRLCAVAGRFPTDSRAIMDWEKPLHRRVKQNPMPPLDRLSDNELMGLAKTLQEGAERGQQTLQILFGVVALKRIPNQIPVVPLDQWNFNVKLFV